MHQRSCELPMAARGPVQVAALLRSQATAMALRSAMEAGGRLSVAMTAEGGLPPDLAAHAGADLVVVELDLDAPADLVWLEHLARAADRPPAVAVTCPQPTLDGLRQAMRLGIVDVLPQPIVAADLQAICRAATKRRAAAGPAGSTGRVVSFLKAGGGTGATTVATQMACAAAVRGARAQVLLVDLDVQFGSSALHLDLPQNTSVLDVLASADRIDGSMVRSAAAHHAAGVDVLPAPADLTPLEAVSPASALRLVDAARAEYPLVMIDLPANWTAWTRELLAASDALVLVLELSVPSIRHARRQIDTLAEEGLGQLPLALVANRVPAGLFAKAPAVSRGEAERALGRAVTALLPRHDLLLRAATLGQPVAGLAGGKAVGKRFAGLVEAVAGRPGRTRAAPKKEL